MPGVRNQAIPRTRFLFAALSSLNHLRPPHFASKVSYSAAPQPPPSFPPKNRAPIPSKSLSLRSNPLLMNHNDNTLPPLQLNAAQTTLLEDIMAALGRSPAYAHAPTMRQLMAYPYAATDAALPEAQRLQVAAESALRELRMAQMGWSMLGVCTLKTLAAEVKDLEKAHPEWAVRPVNSSAPPPRTAAPAVPVMEVKAERPSQSSPRPNTAANRRAPLFRQITPDERRANLIVLLACVLTVGLILGAAAVAYFGFGAANVAKDIAVGAGTVATLQLVRVARQWHRRFAVRFNLCRLAVCLALLFSSAAYHGARGIVKGICLLASNDHLYAPSAISGMALCTLAALALKYAVNRLPAAHFHRAPWLGWGIGLLLTLAAGFFLSMAIQK